MPPIEIYVGTHEILFDQCIELYQKLNKCGNDVSIHVGKQMGHVYPLYLVLDGKK